MIDRLALARQFVQEKVQQHPALMAAWVGGSLARGEDTESSDIDLVLLVSEAITEEVARGGVDTWREGVYIEAGFVPHKEYSELETVLHDPFKATHMNDALILYDPTGFVTQMQHRVRPLFMEPQWLSKRLAFWVEHGRTQCGKLREACTRGDAMAICDAVLWIIFCVVSVPLLRVGKTPSSSRGLLQLGAVAHPLYDQLCLLEGSALLNAADVLALQPLLEDTLPLIDRKSWGDLPKYFVKKSLWLTKQGHVQAGVHAMWMLMGAMATDLSLPDNPEVKAQAISVTDRWLQHMGWVGQASLIAKVELAETLVAAITKEAAALPSSTIVNE